HRRQLQARDLGVQLARNAVHVLRERLRLLDHVLGGERLIGKRHVHHARGVAFRRGQVDQASVGEDEDAPAFETPFVHGLADARCANPRPHHPYPATTTVLPAINRLVARRMPSSVDCPVPYRLSNRCFVSESFTAITGNCSTPSRAIALRRMTPVVVSSVEPTTPVTSALRSPPERVSTQRRTGGARSSSRLRAIMCNAPTKSAPSSMVTSGRCASAARMWS